MKSTTIFFLVIWLMTGCTPSKPTQKVADTPSVDPNEEVWVALFNGKDMTDWMPKFSGHKMGVNYKNTFQVKDGLLKATYVEYQRFKDEYGHLFYTKSKFSHYKLRATYRAVGRHTPGAPGWAYANNGLMLHCQPVETMGLNQSAPLSLECQLLAGKGRGRRTTGNLCTPGCHVTYKGALHKQHCTNSTSKTYHGEQWVNIEVIILGDSIMHHIVEGDTVITYSKPVAGGGWEGLDTDKFPDGMAMKEGYIAIQAESHGFDFKKIELLNLCGCMDKKAKNYKAYYVKHQPETCIYK